MGSDAAWDQVAEDEASALVGLLEQGGRKVLVVVIAVEDDVATLCRGVSANSTAADARGFVQALDRERDRIASKLVRKK